MSQFFVLINNADATSETNPVPQGNLRHNVWMLAAEWRGSAYFQRNTYVSNAEEFGLRSEDKLNIESTF